MLLGSFETGPKWGHLQETVLFLYLGNTAVLCVVVTVLAALLAIPAAWVVTMYRFPGCKLFSWLLVLPLAIPTYVAAFVYYEIPEASIPLLIEIRKAWGVDAFLRAESLIRYGTVSLLMASVLYPYIYLTARASFSQQGRMLIDASRSLGRGASATFFKVALPLARPALVAGASLVVMEVVNDYGAVHLFGIPTLTEGIFRTWFGLEDRASALRLAGLAVLVIVALLYLETLQRGRARFSDSKAASRAERISLSRGKASVAMSVCLVPLLLGLIFPVYQLVRWAMITWSEVFRGEFIGHLINSTALALITAGTLTFMALFLAYAKRLHAFRWLRSIVRVASLGYAVPGAVIAIGVMVSPGGFDRAVSAVNGSFFLSGTLVAIGFAYCVRFMAVSLNPVQSGMIRLCGSHVDASFSLGRGRTATLFSLVIPLLRSPMGAAFILVFVDILKELPLTMILRPANFETMATTAFSLASEGRIQACAVPSIILVGTCALGLACIHRLWTPEAR